MSTLDARWPSASLIWSWGTPVARGGQRGCLDRRDPAGAEERNARRFRHVSSEAATEGGARFVAVTPRPRAW